MSDAPPLGLHWGIKASFVAYIARMPDGRRSVHAGARLLDELVTVFEPSSTDAPPGLAEEDRFWSFRGDVRFAGHHGMLAVRLADPWITVRDGSGEMTVLDPYRPDTEPRLPLVRFTLEPQPVEGPFDTWLATDVHLTAEGTGVFNDVYQPGEPFEPLALFLPSTVATS